MTLQAVLDDIKIRLGLLVLDCELSDDQLVSVVNISLRELQRYFVEPVIETIPYSDCIDLSNKNVDSIYKIWRTNSIATSEDQHGYGMRDPVQTQLYQFSTLGNMYNMTNYTLNYLSWNTLNQIRNTTSTDLAYTFDRNTQKLYINVLDKPANITIAYVKTLVSVEEIKSSYWIDVLIRLALANIKITLGRIRTRYTQSNALWQQDGQSMLQEGTQELSELRQQLQQNQNLFFPID